MNRKNTATTDKLIKAVHGSCDFDVLLTVHLSIILVINQLNAQNLVL